MAAHDIVVVGFSAGGLEALVQVVSDLPADLPASLFVVHHFPASSISVLPRILHRAGPLPAAHAQQGEAIVQGRIYVAPPDRHLLIGLDTVLLSSGPRENRYRPAIDVLFRTAAKSYGPRVIALLLSGTLDDGTAGLGMVEQCGGVSVVQDPDDAVYSGMPSSALAHNKVDHVLPVGSIAPLLVRLIAGLGALEEKAS